jgi:hypothetical protein
MSAVSWSAGILPASALGDRKIVHMHDFSVTVAAQRAKQLSWLEFAEFAAFHHHPAMLHQSEAALTKWPTKIAKVYDKA